MRKIKEIIIHCSATKEGRIVSVAFSVSVIIS